jgi:hypothetical protein
LTKWNIICRPKEQEGLGIEVLELKNKCLLAKWLFKILNEQGVWQELIRNKYLHSQTLSQVSAKPGDSPFWKGLKQIFFDRGSFKVGNGEDTSFWEDTWLGDKPLAQQYPSLYNIVQHKQVTVASILGQNPPNITFRRILTRNKWDRWLHLVNRLMAVNRLTRAVVFTVKSMYLDYMNGHTIFF